VLSPDVTQIPSAGSDAISEFLKVELDAQDLQTAPQSHHVFYQWEVEYTRPLTGSDTITTAPADFVIGCTPDMLTQQLERQRDDFLKIYDVENPHVGIPAPHLSHEFVSIEDMGFGVSSAPPLQQTLFLPWPADVEVTSFLPAVTLYEARRLDDESDEDYRTRVSDTFGADAPYDLIGWVYGAIYKTNAPPPFGCIPSSEWFIHEPGYHLEDGTMFVQQVDEAVSGERDDFGTMSLTLIPGFNAPATGPTVRYFHGRGWTLHVWLDPEDKAGGTPTLSLEVPGADQIVGPPEDAVLPGMAMPGLFVDNDVWD
jgi:hypothetical protein